MYLDAMSARYYFRSNAEGIYVITSSDENFKQGDRIISVNSTAVVTEAEISAAIKKISIGDEVVFGIVRGGVTSEVKIIAKEYIPEGVAG